MLQIPIFPLPNVVFFPKTLLPLHIFEPRYKRMVSQALQGSRFLGLLLLKPRWEPHYQGSPEAYEIGCLGRIQAVEELEEGRYNITLLGIQKFRVVRYVQMTPHRIATVQLIEEAAGDEKDATLQAEKAELLRLQKLLTDRIVANSPVNPGGVTELSFEAVVNNLVAAGNMDVQIKQQFLEMDEIRKRGQSIRRFMQQQLEALEFHDRFRHLVSMDPSKN